MQCTKPPKWLLAFLYSSLQSKTFQGCSDVSSSWFLCLAWDICLLSIRCSVSGWSAALYTMNDLRRQLKNVTTLEMKSFVRNVSSLHASICRHSVHVTYKHSQCIGTTFLSFPHPYTVLHIPKEQRHHHKMEAGWLDTLLKPLKRSAVQIYSIIALHSEQDWKKWTFQTVYWTHYSAHDLKNASYNHNIPSMEV